MTSFTLVTLVVSHWLLTYDVVFAADDTVRTSASAVLHERAKLPCDVTTQIGNDRPVLILWYQDSAGTPIYSFDARRTDIEGGTHWSDNRLLNQRAYFQFLPSTPWYNSVPKVFSSANGQNQDSSTRESNPFSSPLTMKTSRSSYVDSPEEKKSMGAQLELYPVEDRDQATYRCRVDFLLSPTKNTIINFTVIVPPSRPEIFNETDDHVGGGPLGGATIIGPYNEGHALLLHCIVQGGRPKPTIRWLINDMVVESKSTRLKDNTVEKSLMLPNLTRENLHSILECQATNSNDTSSLSTTVSLDMNFEPQNVSILNANQSLSSGSSYELVCQAWGSRPAATITWWKGSTNQIKDAKISVSPDNNITTSILQYSATMSDNGKYLTCRAENADIQGSTKEDTIQLNIQYKPVVTLQLGSSLDPENIKEKDDIYFDCHVNSNPMVNRMTWYMNGSPLLHDINKGIIITNHSLVIQMVGRESAGLYTCRGTNSEGMGESQPVALNVLYSPYCKKQSKSIYGTALHEPASVTCELEANPGPVVFRWTFNNTSEHLPIPASAVVSKDFTSIASYAPKSHLDYGTLLCWAYNSIGTQSTPCAFSIIPAGPPDPLRSCSIANQTTDTIEVTCLGGFDGGMPQRFHMEVYASQSGALYRNLSSDRPVFRMTAMQPGLPFTMHAYASNAKGPSTVSKLETFTLKVAEKRTGPPSFIEFTPLLGIFIGIILAIVLSATIIMVVMRLRKPTDGPQRPINMALEEDKDIDIRPINHRPVSGSSLIRVKDSNGSAPVNNNGGPASHARTVKTAPQSGKSNNVYLSDATEDNDPDVIPHKNDMSYTNYSTLDRDHEKSETEARTAGDGFIRTLPRQLQKSEESSPTFGRVSPSALKYVELDLPGLSGTAPPHDNHTNTNNEDLNERQQYSSRAKPPYDLSLRSNNPSPLVYKNEDTGLANAERHYSDKLNLIKQRQLLIQAKQEELKLLKEQRRQSLLHSPNHLSTRGEYSTEKMNPSGNEFNCQFNQDNSNPFCSPHNPNYIDSSMRIDNPNYGSNNSDAHFNALMMASQQAVMADEEDRYIYAALKSNDGDNSSIENHHGSYPKHISSAIMDDHTESIV